MLPDNKLAKLKDTIKEYSKEEIIWINGYLSGLLENYNIQSDSFSEPIAKILSKPTIIYGTETGNSKKVATQLQVILKKNKIQAKTVDASQYSIENLSKEDFLFVIMSTQGEGEPPQAALKFYDNLHNISSDLSKLKFAVFGLGDTSYPLFCKAGEDVDLQLEKLGAARLLTLQKADVDFQETTDKWVTSVLNAIQNTAQSTKTESSTQINISNDKKTYIGQITSNIILNDIGSNKETHHIEIICEDEIHYSPGDALGIYPYNSEIEILQLQDFFEAKIDFDNLKNKSIRGLSKKSLEKIGAIIDVEITEEKADLIDVLEKYLIHKKLESIDAIDQVLYKVTPRLYSISSSKEFHDGQVHLTVALDTFKTNGKEKRGFASNLLTNFSAGHEFEFYIHKNNHFKLPSDDTDVIMIGPGTGIAPFRSFLAERDARGAEAKNWLFFGEQHFVTDFYYQTEIQEWLSTGLLTHLDTAFSRDQKDKIYVQHRIKQKGKFFNQWLENGASLYICGQKNPMSIDVENTIIEVISEHRGVTIDDAKSILEVLEENGKYVKDVY